MRNLRTLKQTKEWYRKHPVRYQCKQWIIPNLKLAWLLLPFVKARWIKVAADCFEAALNSLEHYEGEGSARELALDMARECYRSEINSPVNVCLDARYVAEEEMSYWGE